MIAKCITIPETGVKPVLVIVQLFPIFNLLHFFLLLGSCGLPTPTPPPQPVTGKHKSCWKSRIANLELTAIAHTKTTVSGMYQIPYISIVGLFCHRHQPKFERKIIYGWRSTALYEKRRLSSWEPYSTNQPLIGRKILMVAAVTQTIKITIKSVNGEH